MFIVSERTGSNFLMFLKKGASAMKLRVNVVTQDKTVNPNSEELGALS